MKTFFAMASQTLLLVFAIVLTFYLAVCFSLNHSHQFKLDQYYHNADWLLQHYDMKNIQPDATFLADKKLLSQFDTQLFVDAQPVIHIERPVVGVITLEYLIVLATDQELILLSRAGEYMERLGAESGIPAPIQNLGLYHGEPVIQAKNGMWRSTFLLEEWQQISLEGVTWSQPHPMSEADSKMLREYFYGKGVSLKRLLLDIRSGQILGNSGVWLNDVLMLLLWLFSLTGIGWLLGRLRSQTVSL